MTWIDPAMRHLFDKYVGEDWHERLLEPDIWKKVFDIPDEELWSTRQDMKNRLKKILNDKKRPVQILFAGKAHPADKPGQEFIRRVYEISQMKEFMGKVVMIEGYDMHLARHLVAGVDI